MNDNIFIFINVLSLFTCIYLFTVYFYIFNLCLSFILNNIIANTSINIIYLFDISFKISLQF